MWVSIRFVWRFRENGICLIKHLMFRTSLSKIAIEQLGGSSPFSENGKHTITITSPFNHCCLTKCLGQIGKNTIKPDTPSITQLTQWSFSWGYINSIFINSMVWGHLICFWWFLSCTVARYEAIGFQHVSTYFVHGTGRLKPYTYHCLN